MTDDQKNQTNRMKRSMFVRIVADGNAVHTFNKGTMQKHSSNIHWKLYPSVVEFGTVEG